MSIILRVVIGLVCVLGFLFIRFRENELFYDPLIPFFKGIYQQQPLPEFDRLKLLFHVVFRYGLHMILSLIVLWVVFLEKGILRFAVVLYLIVFVLLMICFLYVINSNAVSDHGTLFYVRRFLIQPLLILILVPAFFYYRKVNN